MSGPRLQESIWLRLSDELLAELRALGKERGLHLHDIAAIALGLGAELLRKPHKQLRLP